LESDARQSVIEMESELGWRPIDAKS